MRYLRGSTDPYSAQAEALFERLIGYNLIETEYTERSQYELGGYIVKHTPFVRLINVRALTDGWEYVNYFGKTSWSVVPLNVVTTHKKDVRALIELPPSIYGSLYTEIEVTYTAGLKEAPDDVKDALSQMASLLKSGDITEWRVILPNDVLDVIHRYRKEVV